MVVHLTPTIQQRLQDLAVASACTADELAQEGLARFIAYREALHEEVRIARLAVAQGDLLDHEEVMAMMDEIIEHG